VVNVNVEWPLPECNLNLPKNIKKKYIFILNRVLKPTTLYMWTFDISLFLYEKKGQKINNYFFSRFDYSKRSSLNIGLKTAFTGFLTGLCTMQKIDLRGIFKQNIHIINVRDVNIGVWTDLYNLSNGVMENKIGVKWSFRVCLLDVRNPIHLANPYLKPQSLIHLSWRK
jgi:hypothetical protein